MSLGRWLAAAGLVVLTGTAVAVYTMGPASGDGPAREAATPVEAPAGVAAGRTPPPVDAPSGVAATPPPTVAADPLLSGKRRITMVRVGAFESGLALLDGGRLAEVDDDRGRQVFVPTPVGSGQFLVKAYHGGGAGQPVCWQVRNPGDTRPLHVRGAVCRADDPAQRFEITAVADGGPREYLISNRWAYLRNSARSGLIMEELGDAPPASSFRFTDTGPAPRR
ncbi:hypothetical protein [Micromonospora sediminimaris]|uniref:Serine/threonine protein kinase n=1 Tax=Micromonospora sediminimaris TaxID=547162 RepID=A0A9W5UL80_9ACTN|nr:hypothetical protein [Micromonospora sediminimaris]GIJ30974.1 hypothetical protein Vse01_01220 [Micromonospora sediminimaris]SFC18795.1 hypothetical protein SAMN05216284_103125 [Micromonospora sediminimaris]